MTADAVGPRLASVANTIDGTAQLAGVVVQANSVAGGIHHHFPSPALPIPRQLAPVPAHFTGREDETKALEAAREAGARLVVLSGIGGVGKSALATRWLHSYGHDHYSGGQFYADLQALSGPVVPEAVLQQWLRALGVPQPPAGLRELTGLWRSLTFDRTVAVHLDNAADPAQVRPLLPSGAQSLTVVTSRTSLWELGVDGASLHRIGPLDPAAAIDLLARFAGADRVAAEPDAAARLAAACAHHPLPLVLAGARLASRPERPLATVADALTRHTADARANHEDPARMAITDGLNESYTALEARAQRVYRCLGLLPVDVIDPDMVTAACRLTWGEAQRLLEVLTDEQMLELLPPLPFSAERYRLPAAAREHARQLAMRHDGPAVRNRVVRRLTEWMLAVAQLAQVRLTRAQAALQQKDALTPPVRVPFTDDAGAMAWLERHERSLPGVLRMGQERGWDALVWRLVDAFWPLFLRRHPYVLWAEAHEIGLASARRADDPAAVRQMLNSGAIGLSASGRLDEALAWYSEALVAAREAGDTRDEGQAVLGIGACHQEAGRPEQAEQYLHEAIALWEGCDYPRGVALATILLAQIILANDARRALGMLADARATLLSAADPYDAARALALHGHARVLTGDIETGISEMSDAATVFRAAGSIRWLARVLELLGSAHRDGLDLEAARQCYREAAELYTVIRPTDAERLRHLERAL
jgi:tetratricopeptide (TPR) repeat protein